jgi:hypothetical protein
MKNAKLGRGEGKQKIGWRLTGAWPVTCKGAWQALVLGLLVVGCATQSNYIRYLDEWRGETVMRLYKVMGYPTSEETFSDGIRRLRYSQDRSYFNPPSSNTYYVDGRPYTDYSPGYWVTLVCTTDFFADKAGRIQRWEIQGNDCTMTEARLKEQLQAMGKPFPPKE